MGTDKPATLVAVFDDRARAREAIGALNRAGFTDDQISVVTGWLGRKDQYSPDARQLRDAGLGPRHMRNAAPQSAEDAEKVDPASDREAVSGAVTGAEIGAVTAGGAAALVALGVAANVIPGLGLAVGGGLLAIAAAAGAGAVGGSLIGALVGLGLPDPAAHYYLTMVKAGRTLVLVRIDGRYDEARALLADHGGYDMNLRGPARFTTAPANE